MPRTKDNSILSEISDFLTTNEKVCQTLMKIIEKLKLDHRSLGIQEDVRTRYYRGGVFTLLLLFPFLDISTVRSYNLSVIRKMYQAGKDVFYRLKNSPFIDWRKIAYRINLKLLVEAAKGEDDNKQIKCLIADDTDLPKTGMCIELIGRIWSHVKNGSILGFKGLFLGYHDGKSFYGLDFCLCGEKGKNNKKPYGLTGKQLKNRYRKQRNKAMAGYVREQEYFQKKTRMLLSMIKTAIGRGIRFDYLLVDSWFVNYELVTFILTRKIKAHLLGMARMGKTKYLYAGKEYTAKELIDKQKRNRKTKRCRKLNLWYCPVDVTFKDVEVRLFFCKVKRAGKWNILLTTDKNLNFEQAYQLYARRWHIEVFFKESKQYLSLGKCQSQDFDAQIADTTISLLQYNILSLAKRLTDYESIGGLFRDISKETRKLTIADKIWLNILQILAIISEVFDIDLEELCDKIADENQLFAKMLNLEPNKNAA